MAAFDQGGGCACGLQRECDCKSAPVQTTITLPHVPAEWEERWLPLYKAWMDPNTERVILDVRDFSQAPWPVVVQPNLIPGKSSLRITKYWIVFCIDNAGSDYQYIAHKDVIAFQVHERLD